MKITVGELIRLAEGEPPHIINEKWDCATVIPELANFILLEVVGDKTVKDALEVIPRKQA